MREEKELYGMIRNGLMKTCVHAHKNESVGKPTLPLSTHTKLRIDPESLVAGKI